MRVLLTGAAGFIASAVGATLTERGHDVVGVDALISQAHAADASMPDGVRRIDVRDADAVRDVLTSVDVVCHQAAMVGAGVAPADLPLYASHNDLGTAVVLAAMAEQRICRLVLASSMVVYGDGRYACAEHGDQPAGTRRPADLAAGRFDVPCPLCDAAMEWRLVDESASLLPRSSYAASKVAQEHYAAAWARQLPGSVVALRYHNVYGAGMPRDTPYSGVAAMFRSALEGGQPPRVFEDGAQMRDFVHVSDVAAANALAVEQVAAAPVDTFAAYNVCSGQPVSILEVARRVAEGRTQAASDDGGGRAGEGELEPVTTGEFRSGDVRHIVASPTRARTELGFVATTGPAEGLRVFARAPLRSTSR